MTTDTPSAEALADKLAAHNRWRRGDDEPAPDPTELGKTIDAAAAALRSLASERDALRNDFAALQHALVGSTGASAIQRAASLLAERAEADKIISHLRTSLDAAQAATKSEAGWLHRIDVEKTAAWQQGYSQGLHRAAQAPRDVPAGRDDHPMAAAVSTFEGARESCRLLP